MTSFLTFFQEGLLYFFKHHQHFHLLFIAGMTGIFSSRKINRILFYAASFGAGLGITTIFYALFNANTPWYWIVFFGQLWLIMAIIPRLSPGKKAYLNFLPRFALTFLLSISGGILHGIYPANILAPMLPEQGALQRAAIFAVGLEAGLFLIIIILTLISFTLVYGAGISTRKGNFILGLALLAYSLFHITFKLLL